MCTGFLSGVDGVVVFGVVLGYVVGLGILILGILFRGRSTF